MVPHPYRIGSAVRKEPEKKRKKKKKKKKTGDASKPQAPTNSNPPHEESECPRT
jgi:hypothetical protein